MLLSTFVIQYYSKVFVVGFFFFFFFGSLLENNNYNEYACAIITVAFYDELIINKFS